MGDYRVAPEAYVKLLLHAAKHPADAVSGLLVGEDQGQGFAVTDAVPLFHHESPLAPLVEVACAMVDTWCQREKKKIVGYYYASPFATESLSSLSYTGERLADKIEANCSRACVLLVENQQLQSEAKPALQLLLKDVKRGWVRVDNRLRIEEAAAGAAPAKLVTSALTQNAQEQLVDFEAHLEDPAKDWRNPQLLQLLKLNV